MWKKIRERLFGRDAETAASDERQNAIAREFPAVEAVQVRLHETPSRPSTVRLRSEQSRSDASVPRFLASLRMKSLAKLSGGSLHMRKGGK